MENLKEGDLAPDFSLVNQEGESVSLSSYKGKKVFIYFYPRANTPGCTTQSCSVRDSKHELDTLGIVALGISPDSVKKQKNFFEKYSFGFQLLADENHGVAESYAVWAEKSMYGKKYFGIVRSSFLIDENQKIVSAWYKVSPKNTIPYLLKELT